MKKLFYVVLVFFLATMSMNAQEGFQKTTKFAVTLNANYDYDQYASSPVMPNVQLTVHNVMLDLSLAVVNGDDFAGGANLGYLINLSNKVNVYPLLGVYVQDDPSGTYTKFNFGAGGQYHLVKKLYLNARVSRKDVGAGLGLSF